MSSGAVYLWAAQATRRASRLVFLAAAARLLGPAKFGIYILLFTLTEMVAIVSGAGFADFVTRELSRSPANGFQLSVRITQLRLLYSVAFAGGTAFVLYVLSYPTTVVQLALVMAATLFPRALVETSQGALRAAEQFNAFMAIEVVQGASLVAFGSYFLIHRGAGLAGAVWSELGAVATSSVVAVTIGLRWFPRTKSSLPRWTEIIKRTLPFNFYPLVVQVYDRIDVVLLSKLANDAAVGLYSFPYKIYASLQILPYGILGTLLPVLSRSPWGEDSDLLSRRTLDLLFSMALLLVLATTFLATPVIHLILGDGYAGSATALKILTWATIPMFLNYGLNTLLLAQQREKVFFATATVCVVVNVAANAVLIPMYSYRAAAAVTVLTEIVLFAQNCYWIRRATRRFVLPARLALSAGVFVLALLAELILGKYLSGIAAASIALAIFSTYTVATWMPRRRFS